MARPPRREASRHRGVGARDAMPTEPRVVADWDELRTIVEQGGSQWLVLEGTVRETSTVTVPLGSSVIVEGRDVHVVRSAQRRQFDVAVGASVTFSGSWTLEGERSALTGAAFACGAVGSHLCIRGAVAAVVPDAEPDEATGCASLFQTAGELILEEGARVNGWVVGRAQDPSASGAAIRVEGARARLTMRGGEVRDNMCVGLGEAPSPAVQVRDGAHFSLEGGAILDNNLTGTAAVNGGGVYLSEARLTMTGGRISHNAAYCGGGVYAVGDDPRRTLVSLLGGAIEGNAAQFIGGGVYASGSLAVDGGEVLENAALYGGGIYNGDGVLAVSSGSIARNFAMSTQYAGGGVYIGRHGRLKGTGGTIEDNGCEGIGGGVYAKGETELAGTDVTGNLAQMGGGIANDRGEMMLVAGVVEGNRAVTGGGVLNTGCVVITGGVVAQNRAVDAADDLCNHGGSLDLSLCDSLAWFPDAEGRRFSEEGAEHEGPISLAPAALDGPLTLHAEVSVAA